MEILDVPVYCCHLSMVNYMCFTVCTLSLASSTVSERRLCQLWKLSGCQGNTCELCVVDLKPVHKASAGFSGDLIEYNKHLCLS